jgi:hypothetical protein
LKRLFNISCEQKKLLPFYLFFLVLSLATLHLFFFWDKDILFSKQAFWYLENGLSLLGPPNLDPGHPPVFSLLLAFLWKIFGQSLVIGHLVMLPFALGMVWQTYRFVSYFIKGEFVYYAMILVFADTTLLTQYVIQSCDLFTIFFFFLCLNAILYNKKWFLLFGLIGLGISSSRGMINCAVIGLFHIYFLIESRNWKTSFKNTLGIIPIYIPSIIILGSYLIYHYIERGWIGYDPTNSNWGGCFEKVDFTGFIRNIFIYIWRLIDFGRLFYWILGLYYVFLIFKKKIIVDYNIRLLTSLFVISFLAFSPVMLLYKVLNGHRYIINLYIIATILISYILFEKTSIKKFKYIIFSILLTGLLSGNFWVYPDNIAKGWDATLAHIPYYYLRPKMIKYIDDHNIPIDSIGTEVPNDVNLKYIDLSNDNRKFPRKDFQKDNYILYSNIYNMFTDEELKALKGKWLVVKEYKLLQVRMTLYKRPSDN